MSTPVATTVSYDVEPERPWGSPDRAVDAFAAEYGGVSIGAGTGFFAVPAVRELDYEFADAAAADRFEAALRSSPAWAFARVRRWETTQ